MNDEAIQPKESKSIYFRIIACILVGLLIGLSIKNCNSQSELHESSVSAEVKKIQDSTVLPTYTSPKIASRPRVTKQVVVEVLELPTPVVIIPKVLQSEPLQQKPSTVSGDLSWPAEPSPPFPPQ